jgi:antitoxin component of RelBE/YafQ-DinJ toxin-antitoxin module
MKTVNYGDKYQHRITLRVTDEQMEYLAKVSEIMGVTPSEYIRMTINVAMVASRKDIDRMANGEALNLSGKEGSTSNENVETNQHDIVQQ